MNYEKGMDKGDLPPAVPIGGRNEVLGEMRGTEKKKQKRVEKTKNKIDMCSLCICL